MRPCTPAILLALVLAHSGMAFQALAIDAAHTAKAKETSAKAVAFLKAHQDETGSWGEIKGQTGANAYNPGLVGMTALALNGLLDQGVAHDDPAVKKAVAFLLSKAKPTGEIGDGALQIYNTSIALSALSRLKNDPKVALLIKGGQNFMVSKQWQAGMKDPAGKSVDQNHPFFGGAGYGGKHSRPDMSNTQFMLQAMHDTGMDAKDPAMQRALIFLQRNQGTAANDLLKDKITNDGGFIYATSISGLPDQNLIGVPQSEASPELIDEAKAGNRDVSGLRTYGSMTYAGFKSYLFAKLDKDDVRVKAAYGWIKRNYTLEVNPGLPFNAKTNSHLQGLYYYYLTFARALSATGSATLETETKVDGKWVAKTVDWQNDLVDKLAQLQKADGSWTNHADRWMEGDPRLVTAYALIALNNAQGLEK